MNMEEKRSVIECFVHAFNAFDVDTMIALLHPDIEYTRITDGHVTVNSSGEDDFRTMAEQETSLYSSRKLTIMDFFDKADHVIIGISYAGVLAVDQSASMHRGDTVVVEGIAEIIFRDEKIYSITEIY